MGCKLLLLHVDEAGLEVFSAARAGTPPTRLASFGAGERDAFSRWIALNGRQRPCRVLVDLASEAFEPVSLPRLGRRDRQLLLQRKLAQLFSAPGLARAHTMLHRSSNGAAATRVMLHGLSRPGLLLPWLEAAHAGGSEVRAILPSAQLIAALTVVLEAAGTSRQLRVSFSRSGMRLSLVDDGRLCFARVLAEWPLQAAGQSSAWAAEVPRTLTYLRSQGHLDDDEAVAVIVLAAVDEVATPATDVVAATSGTWHYLRAGAGTRRASAPGAADAVLLQRLLEALPSARAATGWRGPRRPWPQRLGRALRARTVIGAGLAVACMLAATEWWLWQDASQPAKPLETLAPPRPAADGDNVGPPAMDAGTAAAPIAAPGAERGRHIDGVLQRPDGRVFLWLDGTLVETRAEAARAVVREWPPRAGERWPAHADAVLTSLPPAPTGAPQ